MFNNICEIQINHLVLYSLSKTNSIAEGTNYRNMPNSWTNNLRGENPGEIENLRSEVSR